LVQGAQALDFSHMASVEQLQFLPLLPHRAVVLVDTPLPAAPIRVFQEARVAVVPIIAV
jgi:hypothetical protein